VAAPVVVKFGGELLEEPTRLDTVVAAIRRIASDPLHTAPLAIVHGGGREIDAALLNAGVEKRQVDGLRITDDRTLEVVVAVLAGTVNTRLVAALVAAGIPAVGLTGADAACGACDVAPAHQAVDGRLVALGRVGVPNDRADARVVATLLSTGFVPVVACIGIADDGQLLNVNADTFAGYLAARLGARRLVIAGTTAGVLDDTGATVRVLEPAAIDRLIHAGTATAGMVAKLRACERALANGVGEVVIVDGRDGLALESAATGAAPASATRLARAGAGRPV
jgi:acetylglutamate kinase